MIYALLPELFHLLFPFHSQFPITLHHLFYTGGHLSLHFRAFLIAQLAFGQHCQLCPFFTPKNPIFLLFLSPYIYIIIIILIIQITNQLHTQFRPVFGPASPDHHTQGQADGEQDLRMENIFEENFFPDLGRKNVF